MKKTEELAKQLADMIKETKMGKLKWSVQCQTTEYNEPSQKQKTEENGVVWNIDECFVSYCCEYKGTEFLMITYDMIQSTKMKTKTTNLVFLPPLGIRYFDVSVLIPYAIETTQILTYQVHALWELLLEMYKADRNSVKLEVSARTPKIENQSGLK